MIRVVAAFAVLLTQFAVFSNLGSSASAAPAIAQTYYVPFEAQQYIGILRTIADNPGCCTSPVISTVSLTSGANGNTVYYDHFEDGYEIDPLNPVQASTIVLSLNSGDVWTQTSNVPVDVSGARGPGNFYDGRDRISSTRPIAVTQTGYSSGAGTLLAGGVQVLDLDKSGLRFDIPAGQNADYNQVFEYTGMVIVASADDTTVDIDVDANGSFETTVTLNEGETHLVNGGVMLGAAVQADIPISVYMATGDIAASYESRFFELYPTAIWSNQSVSPVGAHSSTMGTRVFLFNPGNTAMSVDVLTGTAATTTIAIPARSQASYLMPVDSGARFTGQNNRPFYAFQMITTEGSSTSSYDWGYTLVPGQAATPSVIVPYGPGSEGLTNNYSPVWISPTADTTLYVDLDGDPSTGANTDPAGNKYDFSCFVTALASITVYADGTTNCYLPSQSSAAGGTRNLTGARMYSLDGARLAAAWGQRPNYTGGAPALDMGTTILPFPEILISKGSVLSVDLDGDNLADPGDEITYTVTMENLGIVDVSNMLLTDGTPALTTYVPGSTTLAGTPQSDNVSPFSESPLDGDSPGGGLTVGTIVAGGTKVAEFKMTVNGPIPYGVSQIVNVATMVTQFGPTSATNRRQLDVPPLQIKKTSAPSATPLGSGDGITYTILVANADDAPQTGIAVTDALPAGVSYVAASVAGDIDGTPVSPTGPPNLISGVTLNPGQVLTLTFDVTVDAPIAAGTTEFRNVAQAVSTQYPSPVEDDAEDPAGPEVDLSLTKVDDEIAPLNPGDPLLYTITVTNSGPDEAEDVVVVDTLPAGVTFNAAGSDPSCVEGPVGTITCSLGDLGVASTNFDIAVTINAGVDGFITNEATVSSATPEGNPGDETDSEDTAVDSPPTIEVTKTPTPGSVAEPGADVSFEVSIENTSIEDVTLTGLVDDVFGDLLDAGNPAIANNTCVTMSTAISVGATVTCSFEGFVAGNGSDPDHLNTVTATVIDDEATTANAEGSANVVFTDAAPSVSVTKEASVASVSEPGDVVTFTVTVENTGVEPVTVVSLDDSVFGDLLDAANPDVSNNTCLSLPAALGIGGAFACTFDGFVAGNALDPDHFNTVTFTAEDDEGSSVFDTDDATVAFDDVAPTATVTKDASTGSVVEPGGDVTFTVTIENTGPEDLTISAIDDSVFGDLLDSGNAAVFNNSCATLALTIAALDTVSCTFDASLSGLFGDPDHIDVVTVMLSDDEGTTITPNDDATVGFAPANSSISGLVFEDLDLDGVMDPGEVGLPGVDLEITASGGGITVVTTASDGTWSASVLPGNTSVVVDPTTVPPTYSLTTANATQNVVAVVGSDVPAEDVGYGPPLGAIEGTTFLDLDGNPDWDSYEPPIGGVDLELVDGGNNIVATTTSAGDGSYSFPGVVAGDYTVRVVGSTVPAGLTASTDYDGGTDGSAVVTAVSGEMTSDVDFGHRGTAVVGDTVWVDENDDGVVDVGEDPIPNATVSLLWWGFDNVRGTADDYSFPDQTTDSDGHYSFVSLPPGNYTLEVDISTVGVAMEPTTATSFDVVLNAGDTDMTIDFGFMTEGSLPLTGMEAEHLVLMSALLIALGALVMADGRKRERRYDIALDRLDR